MRIVEYPIALDADIHAKTMSVFGRGLFSREKTCVDGSYTFEMVQSTTRQPKTIREALLEQIEAIRERDKDIAWDCFVDNQ